MYLMTTPEVRHLTGCTCIPNLKRDGLIPARPGGAGRSQGDLWSAPQTVGIAAWQLGRRRGVPPDGSLALALYLARMPLREMQAHIAAGRRYIMVIGETAVHRLVSADEIQAAMRQSIDRVSDEDLGRAYLAGLVPAAIDIGRVLELVLGYEPAPYMDSTDPATVADGTMPPCD